jgi:phage tail sheath gpL-like
MAIPKAVSPSILTPGAYVTVDLLAGAPSPGTGEINILLIAPKTSGGNLTNDTEIRAGGGPATAQTAFGAGSLGHLAAKLLYAKDPAALVDFAAPAPGSGSATISLTASGTPTADNAVDITISGRLIQAPWLNGQSATTFKTNTIALINSKTTDLFVTASDGGGGVIVLTAKTAGNVGNDVLVKAVLTAAATGTEAIAGAATPTNLTGGTTDFDVTTLIANATGKEYHFIVLCTSNVDANLGTTSNVSRIKTSIGTVNTGLNAKLEQVIVGSTKAQASAKTGAIFANTGIAEHFNCINGQSLPCEFAGWLCGLRSGAIKIDPAANLIGTQLDGLYASYQPITDRLTLSQSEDALTNGVTPVSYTANLTPYVVRPITTYSQDASGAADRRLLDTQNVDATYIVTRDVRDNVPKEFPKAKLAKDAASDAEAPDIPGIVEERDLKSWTIDRLTVWRDKAVIDRTKLAASIADGTLIVQVDESDETQANFVIPFKIVKPLAKFSIVSQRFN